MQQGPGAFAGAFSAHRVREGRVLQDAVVDPGCFGHGRPACRAGRHDLPRHSPVFPQVPRLNHIPRGWQWLCRPQTVKKVLSSRHVRMDRTHTGKFSAESVRGHKAECMVQRSILSPGGYQGEGISAARRRAEMGSPWSVFQHAEESGNGCAGLFVVYPERCRNSRTQKGTEKRIHPSTTKSSVTQMPAGPAQAAAPEGVGKKGGECQDDEEQLHGATPFRRCGTLYVYCNVPGADGQQNRGKGKVKPAWRQRLSQKSGNDGHLS